MGVRRATPRGIRDVHKAARIRRLEAEVCAPSTLREWGSMGATWVVERLHPNPGECFSIAMGQGQQRCPSLISGSHTYKDVATRKGTGILDSIPA